MRQCSLCRVYEIKGKGNRTYYIPAMINTSRLVLRVLLCCTFFDFIPSGTLPRNSLYVEGVEGKYQGKHESSFVALSSV